MRSFERVFLVVFFLIIGFALTTKASLASPTSDTLRGYWKFDEMTQGNPATDSSGDGHSVNTFGTGGGPNPTTQKPTTSFPNIHAFDFNGTNQYLEVLNSSDFIDSIYTVTFWVRFDNIHSTHQTLVAKWQVGTRQQFTVQLTAANKIGFWTGDGGSGSSGDLSSTLTPSANTWYHITAVASGTNRTLYINGTANKYTGIGTSTGNGDIELTIGSKKNSGGSYFEFLDGQIDDVRYYKRALSDTEVDELAAGNHTQATWGGSSSTDYETGSNWNINAVPDPYTNVVIDTASSYPLLTGDISLASLTLNPGTSFDAGCHTVTYNDEGELTDNGTYTDGCSTTTPTPSPLPSIQGVSSSKGSCTDAVPGSAPDLFQIDTTSNKAKLYFSPVRGNTNAYTISYGYTPGDMRFGVEKSGNETGVIAYTLNELTPDTNYYVRVRAKNGCSAGIWSNEMKLMTTREGVEEGNRFYKDFATQVIAAITHLVNFN
jgi:hypothetical protein